MPKPCCKNCEYFVVEADGLSWCMMTCENVKEDGSELIVTKVKVCAFEESVCWECGKAIEMLILREYMGC